MQVTFQRLDSELPAPARAHPGDAGWDLVSATDVTLQSGERTAVPTGIAVAIPSGHAGLILPRSGHARRHGLSVVNGPGLIDPGYRGEIAVLLINHGSEIFHCRRGERIAQLVIVPVLQVTWIETDRLDSTERGPDGFGSTGS